MDIKRINTYNDPRFSRQVLQQHGCFLVDGRDPYEVEIIAPHSAVIRGCNPEAYPEIIEEFRFYAPQITVFYNKDRQLVHEFPPEETITIMLDDIQPSQFYVDEEKIEAIRSFIHSWEDIVIQVIPHGERFISADGHTRLYYAVQMGWDRIKAVQSPANDYIYGFVEEALKRNVNSPYDLQRISHSEYEIKWNKFCDDFFSNTTKT